MARRKSPKDDDVRVRDLEHQLQATVAAHAVIAIENVRLATALEDRNRALTQAQAQLGEALDQQMATTEILRVIATSPTDVQPVLDGIATSARRLCDTTDVAVALREGDMWRTVSHDGPLATSLTPRPLDRGSIIGRTILDARTIHVPRTLDLAPDEYGLALRLARQLGFRAALAVPMLRGGVAIGSINLRRAEEGPFSERQIALLEIFAGQAVIAVENVRLFKELEAANRELQAASRHKSEFLANMSHELRTPLNAIIGFSEVLSERMFGDINEKQSEYLQDILESGRHLLSLINDILDLSKIEAGRMELELSDFDLPSVVEYALILVRERASRRGIRLESNIDERLGMTGGDERKVKQVLLNLLSNALKFTPEGGRVDVHARLHDGVAEVSVADTGVGIAPADQAVVFEEFRQVGAADRKVEGTGLGLALCRKFVELHGGRISVTSEVGAGSTFTFTLPLVR